MNKHLIIIIAFLFLPLSVYSEQRICKIKYGEKVNEKRLEKKVFPGDLPESIKKKYGFDCYQIGLEHDENKLPLEDKPIYACCQNYIPFLSEPN